MQGNYAYITTISSANLKIVELSNPEEPIEVGEYHHGCDAITDILVKGNYAYLTCRDEGLKVVDITDPENPFEVGYYDLTGYSNNGVAVKDSLVFVATGEEWWYWANNNQTGLHAIQFNPPTSIKNQAISTTPSKFILQQNYPNPFNPITTISYQLPEATDVKLSIYNSSGQLLQTLLDEKQEAGYHFVKWDAKGVSSGVYFYKIETNGGFEETKKCVVLK